MSNKASEPNTSGAANTADGTASTHEPQNLLDATPRTGSIPFTWGKAARNPGKPNPKNRSTGVFWRSLYPPSAR